MNLKRSFFYFLKPIVAGLLIAALVIYGAKLKDLSPQLSIGSKVSSYNDAVKKASPAVVNIYSQQYINSSIEDKQELQPTGLGSGIITDKKGYILTNYHVIAKADQILIALQDGRLFTASVIGSDQVTDLAVLQIKATNLPVIPQNSRYQPAVGDIVLAIGNPYNLGQTITQGIISATGRSGMSSSGRQDFLQTDAAINAGNSGGALINSRGELVGINTSEFYTKDQSSSYGISFAVPYQLSKRIMNSLITNGRVIRGSLAIEAKNLDPLFSRMWGFKSQKSIIIKKIYPGGPAAKAGVEVNDLLLKINDVAVDNLIAAMDKVAEIKPGTPTKLTLLRKGKEIELEVIVGDLKDMQNTIKN